MVVAARIYLGLIVTILAGVILLVWWVAGFGAVQDLLSPFDLVYYGLAVAILSPGLAMQILGDTPRSDRTPLLFAGVLGCFGLAVAGLLLMPIWMATTTFKEPLYTVYRRHLDAWVKAGGPTASVQAEVVGNCGKIVMTQAGTVGLLLLMTSNRNDFDFQVDVCTKMTVNRVYEQPEFKKAQIIDMLCGEEGRPLFRRLCAASGLPEPSPQ